MAVQVIIQYNAGFEKEKRDKFFLGSAKHAPPGLSLSSIVRPCVFSY